MRYLLITIAMLGIATASQAQQWRLAKSESFQKDIKSQPYYPTTYADYLYYANNLTQYYDEAVGYLKPDRNINTPFSKYYNNKFTYDVNGNKTTESQYIDYNNGSGLTLYSQSNYFYQNGVLDTGSTFIANAAGVPELKTSYKSIVNSAGDVLAMYSYIHTNGKAMVSTAKYYEYDANGFKLLDSSTRYDANGQLLGRNINEYTTDVVGNILTSSSYAYINGVKEFLGKRYYYYNANNQLIGDSVMTFYNGKYIDNQSENFYYRNAQGLLQKRLYRMTSKTTGTYVLHTLNEERYHYDANDNIVARAQTFIDYYPTTGEYHDSIRNHYEAYWPVSTATVEATQSNLRVYPIPSSSFIDIKWTVDKPTRYNARIVNLQGQVVKQWNDKADGSYTKSIHVGELAAGNYYIVLDADGKRYSERIVIAR